MSPQARNDSRRIRVFHVDDDPDDVVLLEFALRREPDLHHVGSALDECDLHEKVAAALPDVLVMDYRMANVDAPSLVRDLRARHPGVRIVLFSGYDDPAALATMRAAGVERCVLKGAGMERILSAIRESGDGMQHA